MLFRSDRKSTRLNSSHLVISYAVFCLKKKKKTNQLIPLIHREHKLQPRTPSSSTLYHVNLYVITPPLFHLAGVYVLLLCFFFFNDTATTEIYTLSLHDALPISWRWPSGTTTTRAAACRKP